MKVIIIPPFVLCATISCSVGFDDLKRPVEGVSGGTCYPNGTCNSGLTCSDNLCTSSFGQDSSFPADLGIPDGFSAPDRSPSTDSGPLSRDVDSFTCVGDGDCQSGQVCHTTRKFCVQCDGRHPNECPAGQACRADFKCVVPDRTDSGISQDTGGQDTGVPPDAGQSRNENTNALCSDGVSNDGDPFVDCDDPDCSGSPFVTVCIDDAGLSRDAGSVGLCEACSHDSDCPVALSASAALFLVPYAEKHVPGGTPCSNGRSCVLGKCSCTS